MKKLMTVDEATLAEIREDAICLIRPGFMRRDEVETQLEDTFENVDADEVESIVRTVWDDEVRAQCERPDGGDFHALSKAFDTLERAGILARMNFTCCGTCAVNEIDHERTPGGTSQYPWREWGYAYFHAQDAERLAFPRQSLYVGFGAFPGSPALPEPQPVDRDERIARHLDADAVVAEKVVEVLMAQGLDVDWSGDPETRVIVHIDDWGKPLPGTESPQKRLLSRLFGR
ncbi:hypothetical protein IEE94_13430 [Yimella sp. cx-573]|nr:hypothetical protein [Yimella sp. cx-573]